MNDLSFKEVCKFIKEDDPDLMDKVDLLLGAILILSPFALGLSPVLVTPALGLLTVKNELTKIGKTLYQKVTKKKDEEVSDKLVRMETAYILICYTAFFDAVGELLPEIKKNLGLKLYEKVSLSESASSRLMNRCKSDCESIQLSEIKVHNAQIGLPNPVHSFKQQTELLIPLYNELTKGFQAFLEGSELWESANGGKKDKILSAIHKLPEKSLDYFRAQYYELALKYNEFYVWSNLQEHKETKRQIKGLSEYLQTHIELTKNSQKAIDLGFTKLGRAIDTIPDQLDLKQAEEVFKALERTYKDAIDQPIIKDTYVAETDKPTLTYPKKSEIFVPQSFKVIYYSGKEQLQLEEKATWASLQSRNDLGPFLLSYLSSSYSTLAPIIIIGHPGSGKSLLTQMLSARLIFPLYTPIRVELRDINAENSITVQIEEQIFKDTGLEARLANLTKHLASYPPLVLLDGYDELLQASGKVFGGYLLDVQKFQERERVQKRPLRTIITSRITLIDKATIPPGSIIIRLDEFDAERRKQWVSVWNRTNTQYYTQADVHPFELTKDDKKIIPLAEQPLLLLMLAIYDSDDNQLKKNRSLDQSILYYSLLHRFIERERMKSKSFQEFDKKERNTEIDKDMERLGVAALGMFNRRSLYIHSTQLNFDLSFFQPDKSMQETEGRILTNSELLLGSFFFVHKSKAERKSVSSNERDIDAAFEFLHNTFGEFLTADFILRRILAETETIFVFRTNDALKHALQSKLEEPVNFQKHWFASLMYTPLYSRPVILDLMREWLRHKLKALKRNTEDFLADLDIIISNQIKRILTTNILPEIMVEKNPAYFVELPLLGHLAIYTLNLILLRTVLSSKGYTFNEEMIKTHEDGTRAWDRLTFLWRSWFSIESLNEFTAILTTKRTGSNIFLKPKKVFATPSRNVRIDSILNVSRVVADNITAGLTGLILYEAMRESAPELKEIQERLESENIELREVILYQKLKNLSRHPSNRIEREAVIQECRYLLHRWPRFNTRIAFEAIRLANQMGDRRMSNEIINSFRDPVHRVDTFHNSLLLRLEFIRLIYETEYHDYRYLSHLFLEVFDDSDPMEILELAPDIFLKFLQFAAFRGDNERIKYLFHKITHKLDLRRLSESSLEAAVALILVAEAYKDRRLIELVSEAILKDQDPRELRYQSPKSLAEILRLARLRKDKKFLHYFFESRMNSILGEGFSPSSFVLAIELIRSAREINQVKFLEYYYHEFLRNLHFTFNIELQVEIIRLAYEFSDHKALKYFFENYDEKERGKKNLINGIERVDVKAIPLDALIDLYRLAKEFGASGFLQEIEQYIPNILTLD